MLLPQPHTKSQVPQRARQISSVLQWDRSLSRYSSASPGLMPSDRTSIRAAIANHSPAQQPRSRGTSCCSTVQLQPKISLRRVLSGLSLSLQIFRTVPDHSVSSDLEPIGQEIVVWRTFRIIVVAVPWDISQGHRHINRHNLQLRPVMTSNGSHVGPIKERRFLSIELDSLMDPTHR